MSKIVFFFAGTGEDGSNTASMKENQALFQDDVIRIYIKGCQEKRVGNGFLFPDLEIAANNIRNAFVGDELDLSQLRENFGHGLYKIRGQNRGQHKIKVDDITLEGFSRGAVTTFATAKKLDDLNIPIHIIANQPVPGETGINKPLYSKYCDLSGCHNIKSAHTFLASYNLEQGFFHNYFFRQMVAKFPPETNAQQILFPYQHHVDWFSSPLIHRHINKLMAENGLVMPNNEKYHIKKWYQDNRSYYFTPQEFMQTIYGVEGVLNKDPIYIEMLIENANEFLAQNNMYMNENIKPEKAAAIIAVAHLSDEEVNIETKIKLCEFVLKDSKRAEQFTKIVNKVTEVCNYLHHETKDDYSNKSQLIQQHATNYKKSIFLDSFEFLSKKTPTLQDKKCFAANIYKAECAFRAQALGINRNIMRMIFKVLTNFITHITGIGLVINTINKVKTGNWLLFNHNRSVNTVRDTRKSVLNDMDKLDIHGNNVEASSFKP